MSTYRLFAPLLLSLASGCAAIENVPPLAATELGPVTQHQDPWFVAGQKALNERKAIQGKTRRAKNVILFVGDGLDTTTVTAARIFDGQSRGEEGEENFLAFERLPYVAFSKTYTTDFQTPDSAGTATAMVTGVKTRSGVLSVNSDVTRDNCAEGLAGAVETILERAEQVGLSTGLVSTAELTHATPASAYAHSASRGWAADSDLPGLARADGCIDIARQLIEFKHGDGVDFAAAGGRAHFISEEMSDPEYPELRGLRADGRDLPAEWTAKSEDHIYAWNKADFDAAGPDKKLLGLFEPEHMQFEADRPDDGAGEPSLAAMTEKAIAALSRNEKGYFLMVEAGRIDHAHHAGNAYRALKDTQAMSQAVAAALSATSNKDTLIIVTADHGHTMTLVGYQSKGTNILGLASVKGDDDVVLREGDDNIPYTSLAYANGPGSVFHDHANHSHGRTAPENPEDKNHRQQALVPMQSETHGGQDVPVYASGPNAHLVSGVMEQNVIYHIMADALGL